MNKPIVLGLLALNFTLGLNTNAWAQATVQVDDAWVRGTVSAQKATGAFMRLTPSAALRLVAVSSAAAGVAEIHEMSMEKDIMRMRRIQGLDLPAGRTTELKPGGYHLMLMDLKAPVKAGDAVRLTLTFEDASQKTFTQEVQATARALGAGHAAAPKAPGAAQPPPNGVPADKAHKH